MMEGSASQIQGRGMKRADRLDQIVLQLRGGQLATARMLGERLAVSDRTIYRDIAELQSSGVRIDGEAGVGYLLRGEPR